MSYRPRSHRWPGTGDTKSAVCPYSGPKPEIASEGPPLAHMGSVAEGGALDRPQALGDGADLAPPYHRSDGDIGWLVTQADVGTLRGEVHTPAAAQMQVQPLAVVGRKLHITAFLGAHHPEQQLWEQKLSRNSTRLAGKRSRFSAYRSSYTSH